MSQESNKGTTKNGTNLLFVVLYQTKVKSTTLGVFESEELAVDVIKTHYKGGHNGAPFEEQWFNVYGMAEYASDGDRILGTFIRTESVQYDVFVHHLNAHGFRVVTAIA